MKRSILPLLILFFAMLSTSPYLQFQALAQNSNSPPPSTNSDRKTIEVVFQVSMVELSKKFPQTMDLYRCSPDKKGSEQQKALREYLGKDAHIELHETSGGVFAGDMSRLWAEAPSFEEKVNLPDEGQIILVSEKFLDKIGGLATDHKTFRRISIDSVELMNQKGERQSMPMGVNVTYRRKLDGYEVMGPGGKLKIFHTRKGEVAGYQRVWRTILPEKKQYAIHSIEKAADLFTKDPLGRALLSDVRKVEVKNIKLAYYERGISDSQQYLQPIYHFSCIAHIMKSENELMQVPYTRQMAALIEPPTQLWPAGRKYTPTKRPENIPSPGED